MTESQCSCAQSTWSLQRHRTYTLENVYKMNVTGLSNTYVLLASMRQSLDLSPAHYTRWRKREGERAAKQKHKLIFSRNFIRALELCGEPSMRHHMVLKPAWKSENHFLSLHQAKRKQTKISGPAFLVPGVWPTLTSLGLFEYHMMSQYRSLRHSYERTVAEGVLC